MARRVIITCIGPALRNILQAETHHVSDPKIRQAFQALLKETAECKNGGVLGLETEDDRTTPERPKKAPSQYNLFIGSCIKERPTGQPVAETMKGCALKWRAQKERRNDRPPSR